MNIQSVAALYFSPTGTTRTVTCTVATQLAERLGVSWRELPFNTPAERTCGQLFAEHELVVVGFPTYAGKLPNKIMPDLRQYIKGSDTPAVALVTFGNRAVDNSLAELCAVLHENGFGVVAVASQPTRHCFSQQLGAGHPDTEDLHRLEAFAADVAGKLCGLTVLPEPPVVPGDAAAPYYTPLDADGQPAKFLKAKPCTDAQRCTRCGLCAANCPMGSIDSADPAVVTGVCIKCHSCVRGCPVQAKYFDDPVMLSHLKMLEEHFGSEKQVSFYL